MIKAPTETFHHAAMIVGPFIIAACLIGCIRSCECYQADNIIEEWVEDQIEDAAKEHFDVDLTIDLTPNRLISTHAHDIFHNIYFPEIFVLKPSHVFLI